MTRTLSKTMTALFALGLLMGALPHASAALGDANLTCTSSPTDLAALPASGGVCTEVATVVKSQRNGNDATFVIAQDETTGSIAGKAVNGRGATFAGPIMGALTVGYEAAESNGVTSVYGICGSSCGKRAFFGNPTSSDASTLNTAGRVVGSNPATTETDFCTTAHTNVDNTAVCMKWPLYGASEAPLNNADEVTAASYGGMPLHLPFIIGTVTLSYRVDGLALAPGESLKLNGIVLDLMYFGEVDRWNHPLIQALNPTATLPDTVIVPVHRCDGSGTTFAWTDYLARSNPGARISANEAFTTGNSCTIPTENCGKTGGAVEAGNTLRASTICGNGNPRVAARVAETNGAFGYVELGTAVANGLDYAALQNPSGNFILPSPASGQAAAAGVATPHPAGDWSEFSIAWSPAPDAYPASSYSYILVWANPLQVTHATSGEKFASTDDVGAYHSCVEYAALKDFLRYVNGDGQSLHAGVSASPIDAATQAKVDDAIDRFMNCGTHVTVTVSNAVSKLGYPLVGQDTNVRGSATSTTTITVADNGSDAFGPRGFTYAASAVSPLVEGQYVRAQALVEVVLPGAGGSELVLVDLLGGSLLYRGFQPDAHDWVADPANLVAGLGAHVVVEFVGQVVDGRLIIRDAVALV